MAPTINMTKPVATAIATFVSIDKFIIFPSVMTPLSHVPSNFGVLMDASTKVRSKKEEQDAAMFDVRCLMLM